MKLSSPSRFAQIGVVLFAGLVAACGADGVAAPDTVPTKIAVSIPDVVGLSAEDAHRALEAQGWLVVTEAIAVDELDSVDLPRAGDVVEQDPPAGSLREPQSRVIVRVVPDYVVIPSTLGLKRDEAFASLSALGLSVTVKEIPSDKPSGTAIDTIPAKETPVEPGSAVMLRIAVPRTHNVGLNLSIHDGLWDYVGDFGCQYTYDDYNLRDGATVQLIGPDGVALSSAVLEPGVITDIGCEWNVAFVNVPEVASYTITVSSSAVGWPSASLGQLQAQQWHLEFYVEAA